VNNQIFITLHIIIVDRTMKEYQIPFIINGALKYGKEITLLYTKRERINIHMPSLTLSDIKDIGISKSRAIDLLTSDIIYFLSQVGDLWRDRNYDLRREALDLVEKVTGYHRNQIELDYETIGNSLTEKNLYRMVNAELGNVEVMDKWIRVEDSEIRAFPRGRVLHILAGNVPGVGVLSLVRGILAKNSNIVKLPSGNPISTLYFVLSFRDVDKNHPVTKTTSVVYWKRGTEIDRIIYNIADVVVAWGSYKAINSIKKKIKPNQLFLEYGPRVSMQFVDRESLLEEKKLVDVARRCAHDIVLHDQKACYSPRVVFVEEEAERFCKALAKALSEEEKKLPKGYTSFDEIAKIYETRNISALLGEKLYRSKFVEWTIILTENFGRVIDHPLSRTVYVMNVRSLKEALQYVNKFTMVVAFSSLKKLNEMKNEVSSRGAERITLVGKMGYPPLGFTSAGAYPISQLTRKISRDLTRDEVLLLDERKSFQKKYSCRWIRLY